MPVQNFEKNVNWKPSMLVLLLLILQLEFVRVEKCTAFVLIYTSRGWSLLMLVVCGTSDYQSMDGTGRLMTGTDFALECVGFAIGNY